MPLREGSITDASRIMLPTYVRVAIWLGIVYMFDPLGRNARNDALALLRLNGMPIWLWGAAFLAAGAAMAWAFYRPERTKGRSRRTFVLALYFAGTIFGLWALVYLGSVIFAGAPLTAPVWPYVAMQACRASARSLIRGEK